MVEADGRANYFAGIAAAAARVLDHHLVGLDVGQAPILARCKTARKQMRERVSEHGEQKARAARTAERRDLLVHAMVIPQYTDPFEKRLRKIATHGVVALFNAIKRHQLDVETAEQKTTDDLATARERKRMKVEMTTSKSQFLRLLSKGAEGEGSVAGKSADAATAEGYAPSDKGAAAEKKKASAASWRVLDEDMLLGAQGDKSWGKEVDGVDASDGDSAEGGAPPRGFGAGFAAGGGEDEAEADLWGNDDEDDSDGGF
jgi:hypothetical protein